MQKHSVISASVLEAMLLESGGFGKGPTEDKLSIVFHTLDTIIPQLGIYRELMKVCYSELIDAVYSRELTGPVNTASDQSQTGTQRVPYFILAQQLITRQDEQRDELVQQMDKVNKRLLEVQAWYDSAQESIQNLEAIKLDQLNTIESLNLNLQSEILKTECLQNDMNVLKRKNDEKCQLMNCDISRLQCELRDLSETVLKLKPYKTSYDELRMALHQPNGSGYQTTELLEVGSSVILTEQKATPVATYSAGLTSDLDNCLQLEQQILAAQNAIIEEYDLYVEETKKVDFEFPIPGYRSCSRDREANDNKLQMTVIKANFRTSLAEIDKELALLRQHKVQLEAHLVELENGRISARSQKPEGNTIQQVCADSTVTTDEGGDNDLSFDPFTPHERLLNKYAVMLYTSANNAKSFFEFSEAAFCPSCAEKTVVCPHKLLKQEHVFKLPTSVTHLKVSRPRIRISTHRNVLSTCRQMLGTADNKQEHVQNEQNVCLVATKFDSVWKDYETRTDQKRHLCRPLTLDRTISLLHQFASYLLSQDTSEMDSNPVRSILDSLYDFMRVRYIELDVLFLATHDFLNAMVNHSVNCKLMTLMTHVLSNNIDACALRYVLLIKNLMQPVTWTKIEDFCQFAIILYPFLTQDDLEVLRLEYISFSENKISETLVIDYIIYMILKQKEPRFLEMETTLLDHPGKDLELMTEQEFIQAIDDAISISCDDNLQRRLYLQTAASLAASSNSQNVVVPIGSLAQITSYLNLLGSAIQVKREIKRNFHSSETIDK